MTSFGTGGMTNSFAEFSKAKLFFCIGTNMTEAHPVASTFVKNAVKNGGKLIVVDPRRHSLADHADIFAQIKVGSDVAFLNGIMHVLIAEDKYDKEFVREHCLNFEEIRSMVTAYPPERASEISGVSVEIIHEIADLMWNIRPSMLAYTLGITEHTCGKNNVMSVANLQMILGNLGKEYAGVNPLRGQNNVQGPATWGCYPMCITAIRKWMTPWPRQNLKDIGVWKAFQTKWASWCRRCWMVWWIKRSRHSIFLEKTSPTRNRISGMWNTALNPRIFWCVRIFSPPRQPALRTWCCRPPPGARTREPLPTPNVG